MTIDVRNRLLIPIALCLLVSACGAEFAYKRGANRDDLETSKKVCSAESGDAAAMEKCLGEHGWVMQNLNGKDSELDPLIDVTASDNRGYVAPVAGESTGPSATQKSAESQRTQPSQSGTPKVKQQAAAVGSTPAEVKKTADPLDTFKVSSWWKLGSGGESMKADMNECVTTLGETHRYNETTQLATRGLIVCMGTKGWRGLRAK